MGYVERTLGPRPRPTLTIGGEAYDVDYVGLDDGGGPSLRLSLQLGQGLMIHRWILLAWQPSETATWDDGFWTVDCAVAEVEEEAHGPPSRARCAPFALPPLYAGVVLERAGAPSRRLELVGATFEADVEPGARRVELRLALQGAELVWAGGPDARAAWCFVEGGVARELVAGERVTFVDPLPRAR